jgi:hypothetical protein
MGIRGQAFRAAEHARKQPHNGVGQDKRSQFSVRQNVVADADHVGGELRFDPVVEAFVMSAKQNQALELG